jgi:hypothetical protein
MMTLQIPFSFLSFKKFIIAFLVITIVVPASFSALPKKAEAIPVVVTLDWAELLGLSEWIVQTLYDAYTLAAEIIIKVKTILIEIHAAYQQLKESVLDPLARFISAVWSNMLVKMMFNYIAGNDRGNSPAFLTNPLLYYGGVAQNTTGLFLNDLLNNTPQMMPSIRYAVRQRIIEENYVRPQRMIQSTFPCPHATPTCTAQERDRAYQAYLEDPRTCPTGNSDDCSFALMRPENDPQRIYEFESARLSSQRNRDVAFAREEITAGSGFHSLKDCIAPERVSGGRHIGGLTNALRDTLTTTVDTVGKVATPIVAIGSIGLNAYNQGQYVVGAVKNGNIVAGLNGADNLLKNVDGSLNSLGGPGTPTGNCGEYLTKTPGTTIMGQTNDYLNNALKLLQSADELDEVITDGVGQVMGWMNGKGLIDSVPQT